MRLHEFLDLKETASAGATGSGSIATVAAPLGGMISRNGSNFFSGTKYTTDNATPNTPAEYKKYKRKKK
jgi:hypothetical protein